MDFTQPKDLLTIGALAAVALGLVVLVFSLLASRRKPAAASPDPEHARLLSEMRELTDRLASELDAKSARLEKLLAAADRKIAALESPAPRAQALEAKPAPEAPRLRPSDTRPNESRGNEPLHQTIHTLADQGLTPVQIAERTSVPTGQVELILALRRTAAR